MKKWIAPTLSFILALSLCACTGNLTKDSTGDPTTANNGAENNHGGENNNSGENNNGGENNNTDSGNFSLLTDVSIRYIDGDEDQIMKIELEYDQDHCIIGAKLYTDGQLDADVIFDKATCKILSQTDYADGVLARTHTYTYDTNGNELTSIITDADGKITYSKTNTYTADGLLETSKDNDTWTAYTYDDHGHALSYRCGNDEEVWTDITYENFYEDGKLTLVNTYSGGHLRWGEYYDTAGNMVKELSYDSEGNVLSKKVHTYENGKLLLKVTTNGDVVTYREEYTYNDAGQLLEIRHIDEGELHGSNVYTYENDVLSNVKLYDHTELEGEYTLSYKKTYVSEEQGKKLTALYELMLEFD